MGYLTPDTDLYAQLDREQQAEVEAERSRQAHLKGYKICGCLLWWNDDERPKVCVMAHNHSGTHL